MLPCDLQQPQIILLKEGTDTSQGKAQLVSNINACVAVVDAVRTTLGPRGMDKLICNERVRWQAAHRNRRCIWFPAFMHSHAALHHICRLALQS